MSALAAVCLSCICYLLTLAEGTVGQEQGSGVKVIVKQDSDAVLPCLISTKEDLTKNTFDWKKDGQKEVFLHDSSGHYNNGRHGQDEQFKGRVSHFQDQLMNGNASIKIQNTKMADSGTYSCIFPHLETFYIELVVGACPKPHIKTLDETKDWSLLQCEVQGASPEPKVEWQDSAGNILPAEKPQVLENGGSYSVTLKTTVTKTDHYSCVATQEELSHNTSAETFVFICENPSSVSEAPSNKEVIGWLGGFILGAVVLAAILAAVLALLVATKRITVTCNRGAR